MSFLLDGLSRIFSRNEETRNELFYSKIWTSIEDMPIWNWNKIIETGDLQYLYKEKNEGLTERLFEVWNDLQDQHMQEFGVDDMLRIRLKTMKKIIKLNDKYIQTGDRSVLNLISVEEQRLEESKTKFDIRFYKVLDVVSNHKGFDVDPKTFTVIKWYHALNNMSNGKTDTK